MIYLVHGDDLVKSRNLIANQQKKLSVEKRIEVNLSEQGAASILNLCQGTDLFGTPPFVLVECSDASKTVLEEFASKLHLVYQEATVILLFGKELAKTSPILKRCKELDIRELLSNKTIEANVFKFVDAVFSKQRLTVYKELEKLLREDNDPFYIFSMFVYGLRNIAYVIHGSPAVDKMNPFVKTKTQAQAKLFDSEKIGQLYNYCYELDKKAKTGAVEPNVMLTLVMEKVLNS